MKFLIHVLHVISILVPALLLLSLVAAELFGPCSIATACGLIPRADANLRLELAFTLAYLVSIAIDGVNEGLRPAPSWPGMRNREAVETPCELSAKKQSGKLIEEGAFVTRP